MKRFREVLTVFAEAGAVTDELFSYLIKAEEQEAKETLEDLLSLEYKIELDALYAHLPCNVKERVIEIL